MIEQIDPTTTTSILTCKSDKRRLADDGHALTCPACGTKYRGRADEIVEFTGEAAYYWGEIQREQMESILEHARRHGYESAIDDVLGREINPSYRTSLREPTRIDWRLLLGMQRDHTVLDIGSGWGRLAFALAPVIHHVYSLEYVRPRLEFQRIMRAQRGDSNITLLHGSFLELPFLENALDWVVFNGVFEWVGLAGTADPEDMQRAVLRESFKIAKPGGRVVIAIENRWGVNTFFGAIDHSGLPYTNLMPRRMADLWVRMRRAKFRNDAATQGYRTYTYGLRGYLDLMRDAGAADVHAYALLPHYNVPRAIIPVYPRISHPAQMYAVDEVWQRASRPAALARRLVQLLIRVGAMRYLYPHYLIVGRKPC